MKANQEFLRQAIELAYNNIEKGGRPFGAVIVKDGKVIASGVNQILTTMIRLHMLNYWRFGQPAKF